MRVLALDTTTRAGSVALVEDDRLVDERSGDAARTHAQRLPGELTALVDANGLAWPDVDLFAVASGPGSFTGLRIGIATIQGLAFVLGRRMVAVPALEALAHLASLDVRPGAVVAAWMDAHRHEVFAALYRVMDASAFTPERLVEVEGPTVGEPAAMLARWAALLAVEPVAFVGDGAVMYADEIARAVPSARLVRPPLLAGAIGRLAIARARRDETIDPAGVHPLYVRRPDAEIARAGANRSSIVPRRD
jgi:tRNA threonylcarbamoyladenosine biosynthesis protein TsaB